MSAFEYTALAANGRKTRGLTEADSERHARRVLRERGLLPLTVRPVGASATQAGATTRDTSRLRLGTTEIVLFTRLLGALLEAGLPLDDALSAIARQSGDASLRRVALDVRAGVLEGRSLADALARFPRTFPEVYLATVGAGEQTRLLPVVRPAARAAAARSSAAMYCSVRPRSACTNTSPGRGARPLGKNTG